MLSLNKIVDVGNISTTKTQKTNTTSSKLQFLGRGKHNSDIFDKSENGKFDLSEAIKNFGKGAISPITAAIKHPLMTIGVLAGTVAACTLVPVLAPIMAVGFGVFSIGQLCKGCYDVIKNCSKGDYDKAEKSFDTVGQGLVGTLLSAIGIKQGAKVANEAKAMAELNADFVPENIQAEIASKANTHSFWKNLKDILSLFTTKNGIKGIVRQFRPTAIKTRATETIDVIRGKQVEKESEIVKRKNIMSKEEFQKTPEGIRRASLTDEQIEAEMKALYDKVFDELEIPKEQRPSLKIRKAEEASGGSYSKSKHTLELNPEGYKSGVFEAEDVMMHEATHCQEALLRAGIPQERVDSIVSKELLSRMQNGEAEEILYGGSFFGSETMRPPKMSPEMKADFADFAKRVLYDKNLTLNKIFGELKLYKKWKAEGLRKISQAEYDKVIKTAEPYISMVRDLIAKHPEFNKQFETPEKALETLCNYAQSHNFRYKIFTNTKINVNDNIFLPPKNLDVPELSGERLVKAEQSLIDNITNTEGNARVSGINGIFATENSFNQYQFAPEEVLAQRNGNGYLIKTLTQKLKEMKEAGNLSKEDEMLMNVLINKAKATIEYKVKGLEYYRKYTRMINNPQDSELVNAVKTLENELMTLKAKITDATTVEYIDKIKILVKTPHVSHMLPVGAIYQLLELLEDKKAA